MIQDENKKQLKEWKQTVTLHYWQRESVSSGSNARKGGMNISSAGGWNARVPRFYGSDIYSNIRALLLHLVTPTIPEDNRDPTVFCNHKAVAGLRPGRLRQPDTRTGPECTWRFSSSYSSSYVSLALVTRICYSITGDECLQALLFLGERTFMVLHLVLGFGGREMWVYILLSYLTVVKSQSF